eukprot:4554453-Amphidinium_carterae.1
MFFCDVLAGTRRYRTSVLEADLDGIAPSYAPDCWRSQRGVVHPHARRLFRELDVSKTGRLGSAELLAFAREAF